MPAFDTEIFPVSISHGHLAEELPEGHLVAPSPRRCARGRSGEVLCLALHPSARTATRKVKLDRLAERASQAYFETAGSVTAALRAAFATINEDVLSFVGASAGMAVDSAGVSPLDAVCAVVRERDLYLAYAGRTLAAVLREGTMMEYPAAGDSPSRALGLTQTVDIHYGHVLLESVATIILVASPDPAWSTLPAPTARLSLRAIGERFAQLSSAHNDPSGALLIRYSPHSAASHAAAPSPAINSPSPAEPASPTAKPRLTPAVPIPSPAIDPIAPRKETPFPPPIPQPISTGEEREESNFTGWAAAAAFGRSFRATLQAAGTALRRGVTGLLPRGTIPEGGSFSLPPSLMLGTAIAIPLIVVAIVGVLYFRKGREIEFNQLMNDARAQISAASTAPSREAWVQALQSLEKAAQYGASDDLTTLRNQAAHSIDTFDGIAPLEFRPALPGGLEPGTMITGLLAGDRELYALDTHQGRVIRLVLGPGGYQPDNTYICQAGVYPDIMVGTPKDIAWVPDITVGQQSSSTSRGGSVVALDSKGVLLYCPPGGKAMAGLLHPPRTGWVTPVAVQVYNGRLYVLDSGAMSLWRFDYQAQESHFSSAPTDYFSTDQDHVLLRDAVDFVVADGEVFLLHADGRITHCRFDPLFTSDLGGSTGATLCSDMPYHDTRPGHADGPTINDVLFSQMVYNPPPEPTLFLLDAHGRGAFRFSLALNFLGRYRVTISPEDQEASALAVGVDKTLFIAVGNQIYFAGVRTP
jgi:hypothetical protein